MSLANLPPEILRKVGGQLPSYRDLAPLARVNWKLWHALNPMLYLRNHHEARKQLESALVWAAVNGQLRTALRA